MVGQDKISHLDRRRNEAEKLGFRAALIPRAAQRRAIEAACRERGWTVTAWYADEGVSAHTDDVTDRCADS